MNPNERLVPPDVNITVERASILACYGFLEPPVVVIDAYCLTWTFQMSLMMPVNDRGAVIIAPFGGEDRSMICPKSRRRDSPRLPVLACTLKVKNPSRFKSLGLRSAPARLKTIKSS